MLLLLLLPFLLVLQFLVACRRAWAIWAEEEEEEEEEGEEAPSSFCLSREARVFRGSFSPGHLA